MMSSHEGLFADGRGLSDLLQGVTLEIFGEGESMGPLTDDMRAEMTSQQSDIKYDVIWHSLNEGLEALVAHGISPNIASFIGAATPRIYVLGRANREPTPAELDRMREVTAKAMDDGALGVASALIYEPGSYAKTDELIALAEVAAKYKGIYVSHIRNESDHEMEAIDELTAIARQAHIPAEIYHFKVAGAMKVGDVVCVHTNITRTGRSSITLGVETWVLRRGQGERVKVTAAEFVLVAVDDNGRPRRLPDEDQNSPAR